MNLPLPTPDDFGHDWKGDALIIIGGIIILLLLFNGIIVP